MSCWFLIFSESDAEHDRAIGDLIRICDRAEVPVTGGGNVAGWRM